MTTLLIDRTNDHINGYHTDKRLNCPACFTVERLRERLDHVEDILREDDGPARMFADARRERRDLLDVLRERGAID